MKKLILLFFLSSIPFQASAQLGLKKLKSRSPKAGVEFDLGSQRFAPVMEFQSLLSNLNLDPQTGVFTTVGLLNAYFLPAEDKDGNLADYNSNANDPDQMLIRADIINMSGGAEKVASFHYMAQKVNRVITPIELKSGYGSKNRFVTKTELKSPGAYEMRFYLAGQHFYTYPFEVIKTESDDPYSPVEAMYTLGGSWEDLALLQVNSNDKGPGHRLNFQPLLAYRGFHVRSGREDLQLNGEAQRKVVLKRREKAIGTFRFEESKGDDIFGDKYVPAFDDFSLRVGREDVTSGLLPFQKVPRVETAGEREVLMEDLTDGDYSIELSVKGMSDRPDFTKVYHFSVSNGKVRPLARADRSRHNDPLTLIETGRDLVIISSK
ncbi:MAG: hypothetical protein HEP71_32905 [Roseivirga sp.]|nr:hypothetical protein [Roseivirga sp.]